MLNEHNCENCIHCTVCARKEAMQGMINELKNSLLFWGLRWRKSISSECRLGTPYTILQLF